MRVTLEIEDAKMKEIIKATRQPKKSPALALALNEFLENRKRQKYLNKALSGGTDYATGNDELEDLSRLEYP